MINASVFLLSPAQDQICPRWQRRKRKIHAAWTVVKSDISALDTKGSLGVRDP